MKTEIFKGDYNCFLNDKEIGQLSKSKLKGDLKNSQTKEDLNKKVTLEIKSNMMGDADLEFNSGVSLFEEASLIKLKIREIPYKLLVKNGCVSCRMPYGNLYLYNSQLQDTSFVNH